MAFAQDVNGDGILSKVELRTGLHDMGKELPMQEVKVEFYLPQYKHMGEAGNGMVLVTPSVIARII